jgi:hypothetical protein
MKMIRTILIALFSAVIGSNAADYFAKQGVSANGGYQIFEYPYKNVTFPGAAVIPMSWFSTDGFPSDVAGRGAAWKIRTYSNHPLYNGNKYKKPIIITQGFEPDFGYDNDNFDDLQSMLDDLRDEATFQAVTSEVSLLKHFYNQGYEIVLVRYQNPNIALEDNAWALQSAIWHVYNNCESNVTPIGIIGPSMGGLLARYAVQSMRDRFTGMLPSISNLILFDSPNRGANIPISIQAFLYYFGYYDRDAGITANRTNLLSPGAKEMLLYYINPNNGYGPETDQGEQSITDYEDVTSEHGRFMADLNSPASLQKVEDYFRYSAGHYRIQTAAITNGSGRSTGMNLPTLTLIGNWWAEQEASECPWYTLWCAGVSPDVADMYLWTASGGGIRNRVYEGDVDGWLAEPGQDEWTFYWKEPVFVESAPGGVRPTYSQIRNKWDANGEDKFNTDVFDYNHAFDAGHAFIPTFSSLGLRKDLGFSANETGNWYRDFLSQAAALKTKSMFANIYMPEANQNHMMITKQNKQWFIGEVNRKSQVLPTAIYSLLNQ